MARTSGSRAASSHTGSLASTEAAAYESLFQRAGIIRCKSIKSQFDYALALTRGTRVRSDAPLPFLREWVTWGAGPYEAYHHLERLEQAASILLAAERLGGAVRLTAAEIERLRRVADQAGVALRITGWAGRQFRDILQYYHQSRLPIVSWTTSASSPVRSSSAQTSRSLRTS